MVKPAKSPVDAERPTLYTLGHSTHPIERFLELLGAHRIAVLADVRSFPGSRRWPQFNQAPLAEVLGRAGIEYRWLKRLGGRRHDKRPDSPHLAWTVAAFRSYADYTESAEFAAGIDELVLLARELPSVRRGALFLAADVDLAWRLFALGLLVERD